MCIHQEWLDQGARWWCPGKYGDMVVLDADPMTITPEDIRHIQVLATIKEGKIIYQADDVECVDCIND